MPRITSRSKTYKRNFLDKVVIRFDFDRTELGKLKDFSVIVQDDFPYQEKKDARVGGIKIDLKKGEIVDNQLQATERWEFLNPSKKKRLVISSSFLAIEYLNRSYTSKTELIRDCEKFAFPFFKKFDIQTLNRLGLRYVDIFDLNFIKKDFDWKKYFKLELLGGIQFAKKKKAKLARSMNQLELKYEREDLRFVYGVWNSDYPNENTRREFIMDLDCYSRFPLEPERDVREAIERYNEHAEDIFESSITDAVREILNKKV